MRLRLGGSAALDSATSDAARLVAGHGHGVAGIQAASAGNGFKRLTTTAARQLGVLARCLCFLFRLNTAECDGSRIFNFLAHDAQYNRRWLMAAK